jgi:hypothetical protein
LHCTQLIWTATWREILYHVSVFSLLVLRAFSLSPL